MDKEERQSNGSRQVPTGENKRRCSNCVNGSGCQQTSLLGRVRLQVEDKDSKQHLQRINRVCRSKSKSN